MTVATQRRKRKPKARASYDASLIKRRRRSKAETESIKSAIYEIAEADQPCTCRQLFYRLVSRGLIEKTEGEYNNTVIRLLSRMRLSNELPWTWVSDNTRWVRRASSHANLLALLEDCQNTYRRDMWRNQPSYVEIWCEKDALAGVLSEVTYGYDVPLYVSRGYSSLSFLKTAADSLAAQDRDCYIYHFGDHDPSGVDIGKQIERRLREFAPDTAITFAKVAVTAEQIEALNLLTRPTKKTDTRSRTFVGESVDVDAIPPSDLRQLCKDCIVQHIDADEWNQTCDIEAAERESFAAFAEKWNQP